jgi:large subunit ribosomal protein L23
MSKERYYQIIKSPAITEKGTMISASNQLVFNVATDATKPEIKAAIEGLFGVKVKAVNTLVRKGKQRVFKGRRALLSDTKKAYVTLAEGQRLDVSAGL